MAAKSRYILHREIQSLLGIWSKLDGFDKQNCKVLIDSKIGTLCDCSRELGDYSYPIMGTILDIEAEIAAAGFDPDSINLMRSKEMKHMMTENDLQYSGEAEARINN